MVNFKELAEPFKENELGHRIQRSGISKNGYQYAYYLTYVTARAIEERLDLVVGPANWKDTFQAAPCGGIMCGISIKCDNEWITKFDGAENTNVEPVKGGFSDSFKRAAVKWGIGRYLYKLENSKAIINEKGRYNDKFKGTETYFNWDPQPMEEWALTEEERKARGSKKQAAAPKKQQVPQPAKAPARPPKATEEFNLIKAQGVTGLHVLSWMEKHESYTRTTPEENKKAINNKLASWYQVTLDGLTPEIVNHVLGRRI